MKWYNIRINTGGRNEIHTSSDNLKEVRARVHVALKNFGFKSGTYSVTVTDQNDPDFFRTFNIRFKN